MLRLAFPVYARTKGPEELRHIHERATRLHATLLVPLLALPDRHRPGAGAVAVRPGLGRRRRARCQLLAVAGMIAAVLTGYPQVMLAVGRPRALLRFNVVLLVGLRRRRPRRRPVRPDDRLHHRRRRLRLLMLWRLQVPARPAHRGHAARPVAHRPGRDRLPAVLLAVAWPLREALVSAGAARVPRPRARPAPPAASPTSSPCAPLPRGVGRHPARRRRVVLPPAPRSGRTCPSKELIEPDVRDRRTGARRRRAASPGRSSSACAPALEHRGPDSRGVFAHDGAGLGIQRLRVIDLDDGRPADLQRGRLGRRRPQRRDLQLPRAARRSSSAGGHRFATQGDTEVIVHLYEEHGERLRRAPARDVRVRALGPPPPAAADRARPRRQEAAPLRPRDGGTLSFASELGALLADPEIPREVDHDGARRATSTYGYVPAPADRASRAVRKLPPAHTLVVAATARSRIAPLLAARLLAQARRCSARRSCCERDPRGAAARRPAGG